MAESQFITSAAAVTIEKDSLSRHILWVQGILMCAPVTGWRS